MNIASLSNINSQFLNEALISGTEKTKDESFGTVFQSAMDMLSETNTLQNKAEEAEINFALGKMDSTSDLMIAQEKANVALNYTIAVRDRFLEAYKEIINMQI